MSLFPAYDTSVPSTSSGPAVDTAENNAAWLKNSSFQPEIISTKIVIVSSDSSDCEFLEPPEPKSPPIISLDSEIEEIHEYPSSRSKKHKKSKKHKSSKDHKIKVEYEPVVENVYFDDKVRDRGNFKVPTLCSRARPLYNLSRRSLGFVSFKSRKKEPSQRYFVIPLVSQKSSKNKKLKTNPQTIPQDDLSTTKDAKDTEAASPTSKEDETKLKIKEFNEKLAEDPQDIDLWINYINYEDPNSKYHIFSQSTRTDVLKYQRKLAIAEKALEKNPHSPRLLKLKLKILDALHPADQYSSHLELLIAKETGNVILWQAIIAATRSSIALCTAPKVLELFTKCFSLLHLWSRASPKSYDDNLLQMLYQSLIFLRHAGLWEQMWEALRMNLSLNLGIFISKGEGEERSCKSSIDEKKLIGMEELILTSQLPLNQLWLRVELLRENCHWTTVTREELELIGDSHRFITPEDVTDFVHPLLTKASNFKMAVYGLLALKVPLLPARHVILEDLRMEEANWSIDSIESLLPLLVPCVGEISGHRTRIRLSRGLIEGGITSGPQYLKFHPAQEGFLDFIRDSFRIIAERLSVEEKNCIYVWWLRFERSLIVLQKHDGIKNEKGLKKLKGILKEFMKKEENRNNLDFYREYAVIEREMGKWENCLNILDTAIENRGNVLLNIRDAGERGAVVGLYKTLVESLLDTRTWESENKSRILGIFRKMSSGDSDEERILETERLLKSYYDEFLGSSDFEEESFVRFFQPNFYYDVVMCYVYFLYVSERRWEEIYGVFEKCRERSRGDRYLEELFCEGEIIFTELIHEKHPRKMSDLQKRLETALEKFPDNFYILSVYAGVESELPNWCIRTSARSQRLWPSISLCLSGRARLNSEICRSDPTALTAALNKLLHYHKRLSKISEINCCPLIWRLYMLLLRERGLCEKRGEEVYHESLASCPWARCIYIDAAEIAPQYLTQIQDVIREKDLRMHVTPEELDILRG